MIQEIIRNGEKFSDGIVYIIQIHHGIELRKYVFLSYEFKVNQGYPR